MPETFHPKPRLKWRPSAATWKSIHRQMCWDFSGILKSMRLDFGIHARLCSCACVACPRLGFSLRAGAAEPASSGCLAFKASSVKRSLQDESKHLRYLGVAVNTPPPVTSLTIVYSGASLARILLKITRLFATLSGLQTRSAGPVCQVCLLVAI